LTNPKPFSINLVGRNFRVVPAYTNGNPDMMTDAPGAILLMKLMTIFSSATTSLADNNGQLCLTALQIVSPNSLTPTFSI
jgi:hypothetical protein